MPLRQSARIGARVSEPVAAPHHRQQAPDVTTEERRIGRQPRRPLARQLPHRQPQREVQVAVDRLIDRGRGDSRRFGRAGQAQRVHGLEPDARVRIGHGTRQERQMRRELGRPSQVATADCAGAHARLRRTEARDRADRDPAHSATAAPRAPRAGDAPAPDRRRPAAPPTRSAPAGRQTRRGASAAPSRVRD